MRKTVPDLDALLLTAILFALLLSGCTDEQPLPSVSLPQSLPRSIKEYELYSWRSGGQWRFTLITGTNRLKTVAEIASPESAIEDDWVKITVEGVPDLTSVLERLPSGTLVVWRGARHPGIDSSTREVALRMPRERLVEDIRSHCAGQSIRLEISR